MTPEHPADYDAPRTCVRCGRDTMHDNRVCTPCSAENDAPRCSCGPHAIVFGSVPDPGCPFHGDDEHRVIPPDEGAS